MKVEHFENGPLQIKVTGVSGDMGEAAIMNLLITADGDAILTLKDPTPISESVFRAKLGQEITLQFCTSFGGSRRPQIARKLRELALLMLEDQSPATG